MKGKTDDDDLIAPDFEQCQEIMAVPHTPPPIYGRPPNSIHQMLIGQL
jgi:hypothetical protein